MLFWSSAGQTPGMRLMDLRVRTAAGAPPGLGRAVVRLVGLGLAIVPLFAGVLPVLVDDRRRGAHDMLAGTMVVYADRPVPIAQEAAAHAPEVPAIQVRAGSGAAAG